VPELPETDHGEDAGGSEGLIARQSELPTNLRESRLYQSNGGPMNFFLQFFGESAAISSLRIPYTAAHRRAALALIAALFRKTVTICSRENCFCSQSIAGSSLCDGNARDPAGVTRMLGQDLIHALLRGRREAVTHDERERLVFGARSRRRRCFGSKKETKGAPQAWMDKFGHPKAPGSLSLNVLLSTGPEQRRVREPR
jgi:hypothetical protein